MSKLYFYMGDINLLFPYDDDDVKIARVSWIKEKYFKHTNQSSTPGMLIQSENEQWLTYLRLLDKVPDLLIPLPNYSVKRKGIFVNDISTEGVISRIYRQQLTRRLIENYILSLRAHK